MATVAARARTLRVNEPIAVSAKQHGFFPKVFVWRGKRHDVRSIESCRTEVRRDWLGKAERHHFRVRTESGIFELTQDLRRDTWLVERIWSSE